MGKYVPVFQPAEQAAAQLCEGMSPPGRYKAITRYITENYCYDYIRAFAVKKRGAMPDLLSCWKKKSGICLDLASLTVVMLRAVEIPSHLVIGYADRQYHAWVEAYPGGSMIRFDPTAEICHKKVSQYSAERRY